MKKEEKRKKLKTKNSLMNNKKIFSIIRKLIYILFLILIIYNILYIINNSMSSKKYVNIFNKICIVVSKDSSMKPIVNENDLIIMYKGKANKINVNDIIGYDINNEIIFHRVIEKYKENGEIYFKTKADNYYHNDLETKNMEQVKGKIIVKIPILGFIFKLFENKIITIIIIIILILKFNYNKFILKKIKARRKKI